MMMKNKLRVFVFFGFLTGMISVSFAQETVLEKNFDDLSLTSGGWTSYDVSGGNDWYVDDFEGDGYAKMSGYDGSSVANEDWLISPAMDLSSYSSVTLTFRTAMNYSPGPDLEIKVSTDYDGTSAPSTATWNDLSATLSSGSWSWVNSGEVNLTSYIGTSVYVAFKYTSTDSENEVWEVDNILIEGEQALSIKNQKVLDFDVSVFPNPAGNFLKLKNFHLVRDVEFFNVIGDKIAVDGDNGLYNISNLVDGVYYVKVINEIDEVKTISFIKD